MKRPAFMFYPGDWRTNAKLRRCSPAARGAWIDLLCTLHDSDEYGVLRWPLKDIAAAAGASIAHVRELVAKGVLKGADSGAEPYVHRPSHAGKQGDPVTLVGTSDGPVWYCSRFVRDEWLRQRRGSSTRFDSDNQPRRNSILPPEYQTPMPPPNPSPTRRVGERQGDGPSYSISITERAPVEDQYPDLDVVAAGRMGGEKAETADCDRPMRSRIAVALGEHDLPISPLHPDVIAGVAEGVTVDEVVSLIPVHPGKPPAYILAAARTLHASAPRVVSPSGGVIRAGPASSSKTMQALQAIEKLKSGHSNPSSLVPESDCRRLPTARLSGA